jgi:elongation factor P
MVTSNQLNPGLILSLNNKLYRVESSVKVTAAKGNPFIKTKLRDLSNDSVVEKTFKLNQNLKDVALNDRSLEFLYLEGKDYLFLDIGNLNQVLVPANIVGNRANYLKEGVGVKASFYGDSIFTIELPQFLELMVVKTEGSGKQNAGGTKIAVLETGAQIEVPPFIEAGDIIKVDTIADEYIQRV